MSGGSLDYIYYKVDEAADSIDSRTENPLYRAFAEHLRMVSVALHDVEWEFSGDYGEGEAEEMVKKVLGDSADKKAMDILKTDAEELIKRIEKFV